MPEQKVSKIPKAAKKPADRRPKKDAPELYEFTWDGSTFRLPPAESAVDKISGKSLRDAFMDGEEGQMRLGFTLLEMVDAEPGALDALYSMPAPDMLDHIQKWMELRSEEGEATVGESLRSLS